LTALRVFVLGGGASPGDHRVGAMQYLEEPSVPVHALQPTEPFSRFSPLALFSWTARRTRRLIDAGYADARRELQRLRRRRTGTRALEGGAAPGGAGLPARGDMKARRAGAAVLGLVAALAVSAACTRTSQRADRPAPAAAVPPPAVQGADAPLPEPDALIGPPRQVVLVAVAGLVPRAYLPPPGAAPWMPLLARLAERGAAGEGMVGVAPAVAGPAHATLVTGRTPAVHGVAGEHPLEEGGTGPERVREAAAIGVPTLWDAAGEAGASVAAIGWPATVGAPVDALFPEVFPVRLGETSVDLLERTATPALLARARALGAERPEAAYPGPVRDALLVGLACHVLAAETAPRLVLLGLSRTLPPLVREGPHAAGAREAFAGVDAELGRLLGCLRAAGRLEETALLVVGDAAFVPVHARVQPNVALEAAGLLVPRSQARAAVTRWDAFARSNGASAFVYARDTDAAVLARRALAEAAEETGAFRVVSAEEMLALGADREAWFGLEAQPGHVFGEAIRGGLVRPSAVRGAAGHITDAPGHRPGFVAWGRGLRPGLRVPRLRQTDVAPTVARLLGLPLPPGDGRALVGLLAMEAAGAR